MTERRTANRFSFTRDRLSNIEPTDKKATYHDTKTPGLVLIVTAAGSKTFYVYRRVAGKPKHIRLGRFPELSCKAARLAAAKVNSDIAEGAYKASCRLKWSELFEAYIEDSKSRIQHWNDAVILNRTHLPEWQDERVNSINRERIVAAHAKLGKEKPTTANRLLSMISCVFRFGLDHGQLEALSSNPASGIRKFPEKARKRFLSPEELERWFEQVYELKSPTFRDFFLMLLFTGHRSGKVRSMRWEDLNLDQKLWRIEKNKNGEEISVHLSPQALEILQSRDQSSEWVFPSKTSRSGHIEEPKKIWHDLCEWAEIDDFKLHDLRHTMASWQAINGVSLPVIGASLGHKSVASTSRYAHLTLEPVRESVDAAVAAMEAVRSGPESPSVAPESTQTTDATQRLSEAKKLLEAGLIEPADYEQIKAKVIESL